jgi:hypothetical protein
MRRVLAVLLIISVLTMFLMATPRTARASTCFNAIDYGATIYNSHGTLSSGVYTATYIANEGTMSGSDGWKVIEIRLVLPTAVTIENIKFETKQTEVLPIVGEELWRIWVGNTTTLMTPTYLGSPISSYAAANGVSPDETTGSKNHGDFTRTPPFSYSDDHDWSEWALPSSWNIAGTRQLILQGRILFQRGDPEDPQPDVELLMRNFQFCTDDTVPTLTPTITPTPTLTPTPSPTPVIPGLPTAPRCDLIRQDIATFENLFAWQILPESAGAGHPPGDTDGLTMPSGVTADLELNLDTAAQYVIRLEFHRTTASTGGVFEMQLGTEPAFKVDIDPGDSGTQVFEVPAANYTPNPGNYNMEGSALYKLALTAPTWSPNPGLVLDFICISVNTEGGGPGSGGGTGDAGGGGLFGGGIQQTACEECSYNPVGDLFQDIPRLIEWLWCGLSQLFDCVLRNVLFGLWQTIIRIIQIIAFLRLWAGLIIERAIAWVLGNLGVLAAWIGGHIINLLTAIGTPILNFASGFINGVLSLLAGLWGFFQQVLVVLSAIATFLTSAVGLVGNGFQFVVSIVEQIWHFISQVVGIVPILIGSLIAGLNASAASIPSWAPACNNPSSLLYYPCLGMYVLDNTIFLGPVYYLVPIAIALVAWQVIGWAIKQFREALTAR